MKTTMKIRARMRRDYCVIFLFLAVVVSIFVLRHMEVLEFGHKVNSIINGSSDIHHSFCTFQPLSPEAALEERLLIDTILWPETPLLPDPLVVEQTSDPAHSTFTILPRRGGGQWCVGDQLEVMIKISDFQGRPKKFGGDFLLARLHNLKLGAGVAGQVVDHLNGSYSAVFSLLWEGDAQVEVMMVHPSEAIPVLKRLNREQPDRVHFKSLFHSGSLSETTMCDVCLRPTQPLCNYTDLRTGEPWFCYKPKKLSCDSRINHFSGDFSRNLKANEEKLFQSNVNLKVYIQAPLPASITVLPKEEGQPKLKSNRVTSGPSGYYYQGVWRALDGTTIQQFNAPAISHCLKGKMVHMYGDSTIRQWYEFLAKLPDLRKFDLHNPIQAGPFMALNFANNILLTYRCHGPPIRFSTVPTSNFPYVANEIDGLKGGTDTVVVLSVWAHFNAFPMEVYIRRLMSIRRAVVRLLERAPGTLVIIRTANPRELNFYQALNFSDWYALQRSKVLRAIFKGLNVRLINAWPMVVAHHLQHELHPKPPIIKNMIDILMSYICLPKGG